MPDAKDPHLAAGPRHLDETQAAAEIGVPIAAARERSRAYQASRKRFPDRLAGPAAGRRG
jgi:hypothetical protein